MNDKKIIDHFRSEVGTNFAFRRSNVPILGPGTNYPGLVWLSSVPPDIFGIAP
jgi:hypothetical protein